MTTQRPLRIISLLPSASEIVASLGLAECLVGRSHECDYPPQIINLPICTQARLDSRRSSLEIDADVQSLLRSALSLYDLKLEVIEGLEPTHLITQDQCDVCAVSFSEVERAVSQLLNSSPEIISLQPHRLADIWADIERVASCLNVSAQAVIDDIKARITTIKHNIENLSERPKVVALEWIEPLMGAGSWLPELLELAGGQPFLGEAGQPSSYLSWDTLEQVNPDALIIMPCGFDLERTQQEARQLTQQPAWNTLKAVQQGRVYLTDGNAYFNRPGPRLIESLEILAEILHPTEFPRRYSEAVWKAFV